MNLGDLAQSRDDAVDRIVSDDPSLPALAHEVVTRHDRTICHGKDNQHLHDARFQRFRLGGGDLAQRRFDRNRTEPEGRNAGEVDLVRRGHFKRKR